MRDIKFRGKRVDNGEWVYGDLMQNYIHHQDYLTIVVHGCIYHKVVPETVGQYTEIEDVFFKGSYFGDVVKYIDDAGNQQLGVISRYEDEWNGYIRAIGGDDEGNQDGELGHTTFEVIGNIHDNPNLLKK